MRRPDVKTPLAGAGGAGEATEAGNLSADSTAPGTMHCQCRLNFPGCLVCRRWDRTIRGIEARRADSLRRQSMGTLAFGGA